MSITTTLTIRHCSIEIGYSNYSAQQGNAPHSLAVWVPAPFTPRGEIACLGYARRKEFGTTSELTAAMECEVERLEGLIATQEARVECSRDAHERMIKALLPVPDTASLPAIRLEARASLRAYLSREIQAMQSNAITKGKILGLLETRI